MPAFDPMTHPWLLALSVALATLVSEDAALFGAAALVASGRWGLAQAFAATSLGIAAGDLGLYGMGLGAGRMVQARPWSRRWLGPERLAEGRRWLEAGGPGLILACRFVPGARLTCYTAAGATRCAFWPFAAAVVCSTLLWVGLVLGLVLCAVCLRTMQSVLYGVRVYDASTMLAVVGVLAMVTLVATVVPTLRIAGIDPAKTLREE